MIRLRATLSLVLLMAACFLIITPGPASAAQEVTVYCDNGYPPYAFEKDGAAQGIYVEILQKAFAKLDGYQVSIKPIPWKRGLADLESGQAFALFPPYKRPELRPWIKPYSEPILEEKVVVFLREDLMDKARSNWPEDYFGLTIGKNSGFSIGGEKFEQAVKDGKIKVEEAGTNETNLLKLANKRQDGYVNDRLSILLEWKRLEKEGQIKGGVGIKEAATVAGEWGYLGYTDMDKGKFAFKADFVAKLDAVIKEMKASGEVQKIIEAYMSKAMK